VARNKILGNDMKNIVYVLKVELMNCTEWIKIKY